MSPPSESRFPWWVSVGTLVLLGAFFLLALVAFRELGLQAFRVPAVSMAPTLEIGDHFLARRGVYGMRLRNPVTHDVVLQISRGRSPVPGEVIVFVYPKDRSKVFVKRVVAVGGQTVELHGSTLLVDGVARDEPYATYVGQGHDLSPTRVPEGYVFCLGDNRNLSYDSRFWGPVPLDDVLGLVEVIYWSQDAQGRLRWDRMGRWIR